MRSKKPAPPATQLVHLKPSQVKAFGEVTRRVEIARAQMGQAVEAQRLALVMLGLKPEDVRSFDPEKGTLTVADATEPSKENHDG